jgi:hypothetical protein
MQIAKHLGTHGLFWYFRFNGNFVRFNGILIEDEIIKNDFDLCAAVCFTKVRPFVLILKYNCFTHELLMPKVRLFL